MSILDDAIREHLELKRAHGADDSELKQLEDEAFGPPQRPDEADPFAEAPTEFLAQPEETAADEPEFGDEAERSGRRPDVADLQEAPSEDAGGGLFDFEDETSPAPDAPPPSPADAADVPLPPPPGGPAADLAPPTGEEAAAPSADAPAPPLDDAPAPPSDEAPLVEEAPVPTDDAPAPPTDEELPAPASATEEPPSVEEELPTDAGPDTQERHLIADQPTQMFDVQAHVDAEAGAPVTGEQPSPTDEELVDAAQDEPHAAPPAPEDAGPPTELYVQPPLDTRGPDAEVAGHPPTEGEAEEGSAEFDFFNEQRLSDELDQALEAPLPPTDEHLAMPRYEDAEAPGQGGIFDFESGVGEPARAPEGEPYEEDPSQEVLRRADEAEAAEEPAGDDDVPEDEREFDPETGHEDVLEDTPRFLEDAPEDDDLWFEQKPPKDFDLD
ncbi:MAG TPA: hypothetical protein VHZ54_14730 [Solirubrobacterales bacterium]|nr:hypothetical protein [Solirubrobacterales bacterium]